MTQRIESVRGAAMGGSNLRSGGHGHDDNTPITELLERYAMSTAIAPRGDLAARIGAAVAAAPEPTPPRRYVWAVLALDVRGAAGTFRQMLATVAGSGRARTAVRAQSLALVMATVLATGALAAAGASGVLELLHQTGPEPNLPAVLQASPRPSALNGVPVPVPAPSPTGDASPPLSLPAETPRVTAGPGTTDRAEQTPRPTSHALPDQTTEPTPAPGATDRPEPTPRRTPRPTDVPPTQQPEQTDPPATQGPRETEPAETDEPEATDAPRTHEPQETDPPDPGDDGGGSDSTPAPDDGNGDGSDGHGGGHDGGSGGDGGDALDLLSILAGWLVW